MSETNFSPDVPKKVKKKRARIAAWILPASVVALLGAIFSIILFPFGIALFIVALAIIGFNVLREEAPDLD